MVTCRPVDTQPGARKGMSLLKIHTYDSCPSIFLLEYIGWEVQTHTHLYMIRELNVSNEGSSSRESLVSHCGELAFAEAIRMFRS